jgi:hypothetical protein
MIKLFFIPLAIISVSKTKETKDNFFLINNIINVEDSFPSSDHIISGSGNTVSINGDVNINSPYVLSSYELGDLLQRVKNEQIKDSIKSNKVSFNLIAGSNAAGVEIQMENFLIFKGYSIGMLTNGWGYPPFYGYDVNWSRLDTSVHITLGLLPNQ